MPSWQLLQHPCDTLPEELWRNLRNSQVSKSAQLKSEKAHGIVALTDAAAAAAAAVVEPVDYDYDAGYTPKERQAMGASSIAPHEQLVCSMNHLEIPPEALFRRWNCCDFPLSYSIFSINLERNRTINEMISKIAANYVR